MRFGKYRSDEKILHDEYFGDQPSAAFLLTARLVLLCLLSASLVMIYCDIYGFPGSVTVPVCVAAALSGILYILASLFPSSLIYGGAVVSIAGFLWLCRDKVRSYALYYWDYMMLKLDSRLLHTESLMLRDPEKLRRGLEPLRSVLDQAFFLSALALAVIVSVMLVYAVRTRFRLFIPAFLVTVITAPGIASETVGFNFSFILFLISVFGFEAVYSSYELDNAFVYGSLTSAHLADLRSDMDYRRHTRRLLLSKKADSDAVRYHRYTGNMIAMSVITAIVFFAASFAVPEGKGLNYQQVFDALNLITNNAVDSLGDIFGMPIGTADDRGYFSSGRSGGTSDEISLAPPSSSDRPVLEVTLSRNDIPVYLRGDIGVDYTGRSWTSVASVDKKYREAVGEEFYPETEYQVFRRFITAALGFDPEAAVPLQMVSLKYLRSTNVVFQPVAPYELNYRSSDAYDDHGDFILRTVKGTMHRYDSLALTPYVTDTRFTVPGTDRGGSWLVRRVLDNIDGVYAEETDPIGEEYMIERDMIGVPGMTNADYLDMIHRYRGFIADTYMRKCDDPAIKEFRSVIDTEFMNSRSWKELLLEDHITDNEFRYAYARAICDHFRENYDYSLTPGGGADMLGSFLNDTHSGHCALFATAMTLTLRENDIPARYVTGYVVYPGGEPDRNGNFRQVLGERQLHAWTEVYFRGIGWLPFDPTAEVPGYSETAYGVSPESAGTDQSQPKPPETTRVSETAPAPDTTPAETTLPDDSGEDTTAPAGTTPGEETSYTAEDSLFVRLLPMIVIMAVIAALAAVVILFFRSLGAAEKSMIKRFRTLPPYEACAIMYRFVLRLLERKGLKPGCEQLYDFAERVDGSIEMKGLNFFMMDVMPIFEKCEFGKPDTSPVTSDEREAVFRYTSAVYGKVMSDLSYPQRIIMKISLFL